MRFTDSVKQYVCLIYALNYRYFSDLKWFEKRLKEFKIKPKKAMEYVRKMSEIGNTPREIKQKISLLKEMIIDISKIIKKELPKIDLENDLKKLEDW